MLNHMHVSGFDCKTLDRNGLMVIVDISYIDKNNVLLYITNEIILSRFEKNNEILK